MDKSRQQQLTSWLRQQTAPAKAWLRLSSLLGIINALVMVMQAWLLASLLQSLIVLQLFRYQLLPEFMLLLFCFILRAGLTYARELVGFRCGQAVRFALRQQVLNQLSQAGPAWIKGKPAGAWASLLLEQIEDMQDFYARYLPQRMLSVLIPSFVLIALFPINWIAASILLVTAPLIPLFMALVGLGAAEANRRNFIALERLSGQFLDRLRGLDTLRLFNRAEAEITTIARSSEQFRSRTMEVLRLAFLSSAVLEFFASVSIAVVAVYFGFSYLGELHFGSYGTPVTLFAGFLTLILAPEFFQPLRDLGAFYHAKAQAIGAADALERFLQSTKKSASENNEQPLNFTHIENIVASECIITSADGTPLTGSLNFTLNAHDRIVIVGVSGSGKTSLFNALMGFLPYQGSLKVNGYELRELAADDWLRRLAWVGQEPHLPAPTLRENLIQAQMIDDARLQAVLIEAGVDEFIDRLPAGLDTMIDEQAGGLSVGQAQRVALARALLKPAELLLLDEPTASLDALSEKLVTRGLLAASQRQMTLLITHQLDQLDEWQTVWVMKDGCIVQQGNVKNLRAQPGPLADLSASQWGEIIE